MQVGFRFETIDSHYIMATLNLRRIASRGLFLTSLVFVIVVIVAAPLRLLAQETQSQDLGPTNASQTVTASLVLKVHHPELLDDYVTSTQDPKSPSYHRFLSLPSFVFFFAPSSTEILIVTEYLKSFGIQVTDVYADHLLIKATGTVDAFNKAFSFDVHDLSRDGRRFHRPLRKANIPFLLRDIVVTVIGPNNEARFRPRNVRLSDRIKSPFRQQAALPPGTIATGVPGGSAACCRNG